MKPARLLLATILVLEVLGAAALTNTVLIFALAWAVGVRGFAASARDEAHAERCGAEVWLSAFNVSQGRVLRGDVPFRAIVVKPHALAGVGNRLRAIRAGLFLACASGRALVVEGEPAAALLRPRAVLWDAQEWPANARRAYALATRKRHLSIKEVLSGGPSVVLGPEPLLELGAWNQDISEQLKAKPGWRQTLEARGLLLPDAATHAACAAVALFSRGAALEAALRRARVSFAASASGAVRGLGAALHLRTNIEFEQAWLESRGSDEALPRLWEFPPWGNFVKNGKLERRAKTERRAFHQATRQRFDRQRSWEKKREV